MAFTLNLTGTTQVDDSVIKAYDQSFIVAAEQGDVMSALVSYQAQIGASSIEFPKYAGIGAATTPLDEVEDVASTAMSDSKIILTPAEYGQVITSTSLASLQSGGKVNLAAATLVGQGLAKTKNELATLALKASTNVITPGGAAAGSLAATDILTGTVLNNAYRVLKRSNIGFLGNSYVLVAHEDIIADLRQDAGWLDVQKYADPAQSLRNEVGMFKGFRVVSNSSDAMINADEGAGAVDTYDSFVIGFNALGLAESLTPEIRFSNGRDKLGRFVDIGWYGVFKYGLVDTSACYKIKTASSFGANA